MSLLTEAYAIGMAMSEYEPGRVVLVDRTIVTGVGVEPLAALIITPGQGDNSRRSLGSGPSAGMRRLLIESWFPMDAEPDWPMRFIAHLEALEAAFNAETLALFKQGDSILYEPPSSANSKTTGVNLIRQAIRVARYQRS